MHCISANLLIAPSAPYFIAPNFYLKMSLSLYLRVTECADYVTIPVKRVQKPHMSSHCLKYKDYF